ncbi:MAG: helix-turn-helix transcriptional regulator, partial [Bacteroidales bacterium]|nr:helix-turn-helix transcriptional regulator [Bacteroidales bacterium]
KFMDKFNGILLQHMANSELTVDMLGAEMNLSRVQLYRRVKALSGHSPNELLRMARLSRGKQLLQAGHHNISEAAYAVGFSSPSYFAKCYKDFYGENPTETLKK